MATPKQVMDFRPSKGITTAQSNEHQRRWTEKGWGSAESTGNYDRSRELPHSGQFHLRRLTRTYDRIGIR